MPCCSHSYSESSRIVETLPAMRITDVETIVLRLPEVGEVCDGTLTAEDCGRLDALLRGDKAARRFYNDYLFLHAELYSQHASVAKIADSGLRLPDSSAADSKPQSAMRNPKSRFWWAMAAALIGVAAGSS